MKFIMVVIICFGVDCQAIFEPTTYESHDSCYEVAMQTSQFMQQMYPYSAGEVHCFSEQQFSEFQKMLEHGGKPILTNPEYSGLEA